MVEAEFDDFGDALASALELQGVTLDSSQIESAFDQLKCFDLFDIKNAITALLKAKMNIEICFIDNLLRMSRDINENKLPNLQ